ncbi:MAG: protein-L-isoaspartate(D-aspartate) O-methyltransferase [Myxococcales bacterium]|nr:protein-L-isoaspartate(D-aspartate) O-methyltransferase [Myxococcales bacterium]
MRLDRRWLALALALAGCACPPERPQPATSAPGPGPEAREDASAATPAAGERPQGDDAAPREERPPPAEGAAPAPTPPTPAIDWSERQEERDRMVDEQLAPREIRSPAVLAAMRKVPRHLFVPADQTRFAYGDHPLPIGYDVTISQPYIVALMSQLAEVKPGDRVLEIGTGSGYQAAILAELGAEVYSIEIIEPLASEARARLEALGYGDRVHVRNGDGYGGWPEEAPFAAILLTAAPPRVPPPLREQLAIGGRLVAPVGTFVQSLIVLTRTRRGYRQREEGLVRFVPMTGEAGG